MSATFTSQSEVLDGTIQVPSAVLRKLKLNEGDSVSWILDLSSSRICLEKATLGKSPDFRRTEVKSRSRRTILSALQSAPKKFKELSENLEISDPTLSRYLKELHSEGLVTKPHRNSPYRLTDRGREWLELTDIESAEGRDIVIETVVNSDLDLIKGFVVRLPRGLGEVFYDKLCLPKPLNSLNQILILGLEFWVGKWTSQMMELSRDFDGDGIDDLVIGEPRRGYPLLTESRKEGTLGPLYFDFLYKAAEEKLSRNSE